jgi:hypothetical protein
MKSTGVLARRGGREARNFFNPGADTFHRRNMNARHQTVLTTTSILCWLTGCTSGGGADTPAESHVDPITVECAAGSGSDWSCPQALSLDCKDLASATFVVRSPQSLVCSSQQLSVVHVDALTPGKHTLELHDTLDKTLCTSQITITQSTPPKLVPKTVQLWPPNHKLHEIAVSDCVDVVDACPGDDLQPEFVWASSDEPIDDIGDGHKSPDIVLADDCQRVSVRSERQGPKDGRVYKLGVRMQDRAGNVSEATCHVIVDHDQRGVVGADSGEAYRVLFNGTHAGPTCTGNPPPPSTPPAVPPPGSDDGDDRPI